MGRPQRHSGRDGKGLIVPATHKLRARITYLEMDKPPPERMHAPIGMQLAVMRATEMPVHYYRYLYEQVGRPHHWYRRRVLDDASLADVLGARTSSIEILYVNGSPAGFFELELSSLPERAEILYFGLVPDFQGRGLARFMLSCAIAAAWSHSPSKVIIETSTLDSPRALQLYQKMGFSPVGWSEEDVEPWA